MTASSVPSIKPSRRRGKAKAPAKAPAYAEKDARLAQETEAPVRSAGPEAMRDPPQRWDEADEAADASFPASDPPARP